MTVRAGEFTLASWNVRMGLHNDGGRNDVVTECKALDPDVLVLQEAWSWGDRRSTLTRDIASALGAELHEYVSATALRTYPVQWTIAVLTRIPAVRLNDVAVPGLAGAERHMVRVRLTDSNLIITGGHLDGVHSLRQRPHVWWRQRRSFGEIATTTDVLTGDFNMWPPLVHHDGGPLRPAVVGKTWPAPRPHSQIDHMLVSDRVEVLASEVFPNQGSDHRAITARLRRR